MTMSGVWLTRGYFELESREAGPSTTQAIRDELSAALGGVPLRIANYPVGPVWRHTFWWREGTTDYAEAQFFARIAEDYPVLSLGVSVEKGFEGANRGSTKTLDRGTWAWQRLIERLGQLLKIDVPAVASTLQRPINVRIRVSDNDLIAREPRTFCLEDDQWFERYRGSAAVADLSEHLMTLDRRADSWVDLYFSIDLAPSEVDGMSPAAVAQLLLAFEPVRQRVHG